VPYNDRSEIKVDHDIVVDNLDGKTRAARVTQTLNGGSTVFVNSITSRGERRAKDIKDSVLNKLYAILFFLAPLGRAQTVKWTTPIRPTTKFSSDPWFHEAQIPPS
jgi:hypothetical protein